ERIARSIPPGAHGSIMGIQNIKGTGLDFVYRWVSRDVVERSLLKVESGTAQEHDGGLRELLVHDDYGLFDAREAIARLTAARPPRPPPRRGVRRRPRTPRGHREAPPRRPRRPPPPHGTGQDPTVHRQDARLPRLHPPPANGARGAR